MYHTHEVGGSSPSAPTHSSRRGDYSGAVVVVADDGAFLSVPPREDRSRAGEAGRFVDSSRQDVRESPELSLVLMPHRRGHGDPAMVAEGICRAGNMRRLHAAAQNHVCRIAALRGRAV